MENSIRKQQFSVMASSLFVTMLISKGSQLVDTYVVGQFGDGKEALAAMGLMSPINTAFFLIMYLYSTGARVVATQKLAVMDKEGACDVFNMTLLLTFVSSVILMICAVKYQVEIISLIANGRDLGMTAAYADEYLVGFAFSLPLGSLNALLVPYLRMDGCNTRIKVFSIVFLVTQITLDILVAIFLKGDVYFISLSTLCGNIIGFCILFPHCLKKTSVFRIRLKLPSFTALPKAIVLGSPFFADYVYLTIRKFVFNYLLVPITATFGLASFSLQGRLLSILSVVCTAIAQSFQSVNSMAYKRSSVEDMVDNAKIAINFSKYPLLITLITLLGAEWIARIFVNDPETVASTAFAIRCLGLNMPLLYINLCYRDHLISCGQTKLCNEICFATFIFSVVTPVFLAKHFLLNGLLMATTLTSAVCTLYIYLRVVMINKKLLPDIKGFMLLPADFGSEIEARKTWSITDSASVAAISQEVEDFFVLKKVSDRKCSYISLFAREIAGSSVEQGAASGKPYLIQITATYKKNGESLLLVEDGCSTFDPLERVRQLPSSDGESCESDGLRTLASLTENVSYSKTMSINTFQIAFSAEECVA